GQAPVEPPQELLLLTTLRGDLLRGAGEPRLWLGEVEARMRRGGAVIRGRDHGDDQAADLTPAMDVERRAQSVGGVDQDERRSGARPAMSAVSSRGSTGLAMCV